MELKLYYPLKPFQVSQKFGPKGDPNLVSTYKSVLGFIGHPGWDMVGTTGQVFRAAHDGIVTSVEQDGRGGLGVVLRTKEQYDYDGKKVFFKTVYWHAQTGSIVVKVGDEVACGQIMGKCDSTGVRIGYALAKDSHLHFGLKPNTYITNNPLFPNGYYGIYGENNGYGGAIDPEPFWNGLYAEGIPAYSGIVSSASAIADDIAKSPEPISTKWQLLDALKVALEAVKKIFYNV